MMPFTLTRTRPGQPAETLRAWSYRPTAAHIRAAGVPEDAVRHLGTHEDYQDADAAYALVPTVGTGTGTGPVVGTDAGAGAGTVGGGGAIAH